MRFFNIYSRIAVDLLLVAVIILISFAHAEKVLRNWNGPGGTITTDLYIPSVMFACGRGFVNVDPQQIPELRKFLDFKTQNFSKASLPSTLSTIDLDQYQQYHRYLIYTVGLLWRITGVSWESLRLFLALLYALSIVLVFGIARVYMMSPLAFCVAVLSLIAEAPIVILPILRDFARAIFILSTILLLSIFTSRKHRTNIQILLSITLGIINGIGLGFRRDQLMFLILSAILILLPFSEKFSLKNISKRIILLILMVIAFLLTSYPILNSFQRFGTLGYHDTLMGFGIENDDFAGLARTNYERIPLYNDLFVSSLADAYSYHTFPLRDYESNFRLNPESEKRALLLGYVLWFPADILIRTYSCTARILDKIITFPLPINMTRVYISLLFLIIFIAISPQRAIPLALIILYSSAIQSLQFHFRHNFYLSFIPPLLYLMFCQWAILLLFNTLKEGKNYILILIRECLPFVKKIILYSSLLIITILLPLQTFRLIQSYLVNQLFSYYLTSEITPVPYKEFNTTNSTHKIYALQKPLHTLINQETPLTPFYHLSYLVVDIIVNSFPACFDILYDGTADFSCTLSITIPGNSSNNSTPSTIRYFIPAVEFYTNKDHWNRLVAICVKSNQVEVKNIYQICNEDKIPLPLFFYISDKHNYIPYQQIAQSNHEKQTINPCWRPYGPSEKDIILKEALQKSRSGQLKESLQLLENAYQDEPYHFEYMITAGKLLEDVNDFYGALQIYTNLLKERPYESIIGIFIDNLLKQQNLPPYEIENKWKQIAEEIPESPIAHYFYSMHITDTAQAREELLKSIQSYPELTIASKHSAELLLPREIFELFLEAPLNSPSTTYTKCPTTSLKEQVSFLVSSASLLVEKGEFDRGKEILNLLLNVCPELPDIYPPLVSLYTQPPNQNPFLATYYAKTYVDLKPYELDPTNKLENIYQNTQFIPVDEWISIWRDLHRKHPKSPCVLCGLGRALESAGDANSAEEIYIKATKKGKKDDPCLFLAYYRLINLYFNKNDFKKANETLTRALTLYPDNKYLLQLRQKLKFKD